MKALITGIAGFAGNYLAELLLDHGYEVFGASLESQFKPFLPFDRGAVHYCSVNLTDQRMVRDYLAQTGPDLIFHLAARSSPSQSVNCPEETYAVNFGGTLSVLEGIRLEGLRCRFLLVSSSHVYGGSGKLGDRVKEDAAMRPETPYAASKAAAELAAWQYWKSFGIETITARAFNHSGPGQGLGFVCPDLARKIVEIERGLRPPNLEVRGLDREIDFSDVRDVVRGYHKALCTGCPGEVYNLCSGRPITIRAIAEELAAGSAKEISVKAPASAPESEARRGIIGDNSRAARELGWEPAIPMTETLSLVIDYWRRNYDAPPRSVPSGAPPGACRLAPE